MPTRIGLLATAGAVLGLAVLLGLSGCSSRASADVPEHVARLALTYTVRPSGTVHVVENIRYDFGSTPDRHGIQRFLDSRFSRSATEDRVYEYSHIHVSSPTGASALFSTATQNNLLIQVGNRNATVSGTQTYVLSYDIRGALNRTIGESDLDEFYWNATGTQWTVPIDETTIAVHSVGTPVAVSCAAGAVGSTTKCGRVRRSGGTTVFSEGLLPVGNGVTIDVGWRAGSFLKTSPILAPVRTADSPVLYTGSNDGPDPFSTPWNWGGGLALLALIPLGVLVSVRQRRDDQEYANEPPGMLPTSPRGAPVRRASASHTIVPFYEPPFGFPVGAVSLLMNKRQSKTDVTVTLLDLAARGHLRIEEMQREKRAKATDYALVATPDKAKATDKKPLLAHEQLLLHALFAGTATTVTLNSLKRSFGVQYSAVETAIAAWVQGVGVFLGKLERGHPVLIAITAISIVTGLIMFAIPGAWLFWPLGASIGSVLSLRMRRRAVRRSALGHAILIQLEGFKLYIATAEADQVRFEEGIDVFSRFLPWATAFGEAEHWTRVFTDLAKEGSYTTLPDWYSGGSSASFPGSLSAHLSAVSSLGNAVSSFNRLAENSVSTAPPSTGSNGGSGFDGGGVGEGGGGGGGGSW